MILKENMMYFQKGECIQKLKDYGKKIWDMNFESSSSKEIFSYPNNVIKKIEKTNFSFISEKEKETILKLLNKEKNGSDKAENEIFEQKFFFFFALLDFIVREKISHKLFYQGEMGYFSGEFKNELGYIQDVNECNPISFYSDSTRKPTINFDVRFETLAKNIGKNFISDMEMKDYLSLLKRYSKFKKSVEEF